MFLSRHPFGSERFFSIVQILDSTNYHFQLSKWVTRVIEGREKTRNSISGERSERTQVEIRNTGNMTLTNVISESQGNIGESNTESQQNEPCLISYEIQVWTQILEEKNNDRIGKIREVRVKTKGMEN